MNNKLRVCELERHVDSPTESRPMELLSDAQLTFEIYAKRSEDRSRSGLAPTQIERASVEHERFFVREPAGQMITFVSNHVSARPV
jgi:hypothetical protein